MQYLYLFFPYLGNIWYFMYVTESTIRIYILLNI